MFLKRFFEAVIEIVKGQGGFVFVEGDPDTDPDTDPDPDTTFKEGDKETIEGQEFTRDKKGNYCIGKLVVLDKRKVPYHNYVSELKRKNKESQTQFEKRIEDQQKIIQDIIARPPTKEEEEREDNDIDKTTGLTWGQIRSLRSATAKQIDESEAPFRESVAETSLATQKKELQDEEGYKKFFANPKLVKELEAKLAQLPTNAKLAKGIVRTAANLIVGNHLPEFMKDAEEAGKIKEREQRKIISEITLGESAGASAGKRIMINDDIKRIMRQTGLSAEDAADVWNTRQEARRRREESKK